MDTYNQISKRIIQYQEKIIGPLAWHVAAKVSGLKVISGETPSVSISGEPKTAVNALVSRFEGIWGRLGKLECQDAVNGITCTMDERDIPEGLK